MAGKESRNSERPPREVHPTFHKTEDGVQIEASAYRDLLRNRNFLYLWSSQMVSAIGDWVIVAVLLTAINALSGGKSYAISLLMLAEFLPAVLLGFLAGVFIDRLDRKNTLIICDISRAFLVVFLPFIHDLWLIYVIVFVMQTFSTIYGPAKDASIPDLVERNQLTNANSLNLLTLYASMAFGTAIAGAVIGFFAYLARINPGFFGRYINPNGAAFFIDSLSFLLSAYFIFKIVGFKRRPKEQRVRLNANQVSSDFREGYNYLRHDPLTRVILILTLACFLGGGTIYVLTVGFVTYVLGASGQTFIYILTTLLFGMMGGSILAGVLRHRIRKERVLGIAIATFGAGVIAFSLITVRALSFAIVVAAGIAMGYGTVGMVTLLQERVAEEFRGRAFAAIQVIMRGSIFASIMVAGPLADLLTALGRRLGIGPFVFGVIRIGGSVTNSQDFRFLINGPQVILFFGGIVILMAGLYGQRAFHRYFGYQHIESAETGERELPEQPAVRKRLTRIVPTPPADLPELGLPPEPPRESQEGGEASGGQAEAEDQAPEKDGK
jgi:MFS family permease